MKTKIDLIGTENTLTRPIIKSVIKDISKQILKMNRDIYSFLNVDSKIVKQKNKLGELKSINAPLTEFYTVEYNETVNAGAELELTVLRTDQMPIYNDKEIDAYLIPICQSKRMTMEVKYFSQSKEAVISKINMLRRMLASGEMYCLHQLEYAYPIPATVITILSHFVDLKNKRLNPPIGFDQYVNDTFDSRAKLILPADGVIQKVDLAIREAQLNVQGYISSTMTDITAEYDDEYNMWAIPFTYEFVYQPPITLFFRYPVMIYNSHIKKVYRKYIRPDEVSDIAKLTYANRGFDTMSNHTSILTILDGRHYLSIPETDDKELPLNPSFMQRLFSVLAIISPANLKMLFNINDIPKVKFKDSIMEFLLEIEADYVHLFRASIFHLELFKNGKKDTTADIRMLRNGDIVTMNDLDIKGYYNVTISMVIDPDMLGKDARDRLRQYILDELEKLDQAENGSEYQTKTADKISTCLTVLNIPESTIKAAINSSERTGDVTVILEQAKYLRIKTVEVSTLLTNVMQSKEG